MQSLIKDSLFIGVCLFIMITASVLLYADFNYIIDRSSTEVIGTIVFKKRLAERKFTSQVLWGPVENNSPIYNYDTIRTDDDSLAVVYLNDGTEIELNSNTLVILSQEENTLDIALQGGVLAARREVLPGRSESGSSFRITSANSKIEMASGGLIAARGIDQSLELNISTGTALFGKGDENITLGANQGIAIDNAGVIKEKNFAYTISGPDEASKFLTADEGYMVDFSWTGTDVATGGISVLVSGDHFFKRDVMEFKASSPGSASGMLPQGTYFWKVKGKSGESAVSRFTIIKDYPAKQLFPADREEFKFAGAEPMVNFHWSGTDYSGSYIVEIFSDAGLVNRAALLPSRGTAISSNSFKEGEYFWRVKNVYAGSIKGKEVVSPVRSFVIKKINELEAPVTADSKSERVVSMIAIGKGKESFRWNPASGADEYEIEIARDSGFQNKVLSGRTRYNYFILPGEVGEGRYYWRVTALAGTKRSAPSKDREFIVKRLAEIQTLAPPDKSRISPGAGSINFSWHDLNRGDNYIIEISRNDSFSDIVLSEKTASTGIRLEKLRTGSYFWRVALLDRNDMRLAMSGPSGFSLSSLTGSPVIMSPSLNSSIDKVKQSRINFRWRPNRESTHYRVEIYNTIQGKKEKIFTGLAETSRFFYDNLSSMPESDYSWEVTGLRYDGKDYLQVTEPAIGVFRVIAGKSFVVPEIRIPPIVIIQSKKE